LIVCFAAFITFGEGSGIKAIKTIGIVALVYFAVYFLAPLSVDLRGLKAGDSSSSYSCVSKNIRAIFPGVSDEAFSWNYMTKESVTSSEILLIDAARPIDSPDSSRNLVTIRGAKEYQPHVLEMMARR
jgi:hypothetical protein